MSNNRIYNPVYIREKLESIVNSVHPNPDKRKIRAVPSDQHVEKYEFACPICKDSAQNLTNQQSF